VRQLREAIQLLRNGMALFFVGACWAGGVLSSGDLVFCITSSAKHASRRAASFGDRVASLAVAHTFVAVASGAEVLSDVNMGCVVDGETAGGVAVGGVTGARSRQLLCGLGAHRLQPHWPPHGHHLRCL